jgi:putative ATPase
MDIFEKNKAPDKPKPGLAPLADRMRPVTFEEFCGQESIIGAGRPLRLAIEEDKVRSLVFWGPPGSGKTTLAELIARYTHGQFVRFSAVSSGIKEVREILTRARGYYEMSGRRTYVFIDEIHRFNKAQQDAFLPYVEKGDIILIGATTENPSFEVISALLSRMRVYVLERLSESDIITLLQRALATAESGLGQMKLTPAEGALELIAGLADGDARRGLSLLEMVAGFVGKKGEVTVEAITKVNQKSMLQYDKSGEEHYNLISALHKSIRGGDPDASLYWLARMLEAGEEPLYIARRLIRFASEDIGNADPYALTLAMSARDAYHFLGTPEGELALAQLVLYMACAPKSNAAYTAYTRARADAAQEGSLGVPLWIRNAPTSLMKEIGYGKGYKYAHDFDQAITDQEYFPEELAGREYYHPKEAGREIKIGEYLTKYREYRKGVIGKEDKD